MHLSPSFHPGINLFSLKIYGFVTDSCCFCVLRMMEYYALKEKSVVECQERHEIV